MPIQVQTGLAELGPLINDKIISNLPTQDIANLRLASESCCAMVQRYSGKATFKPPGRQAVTQLRDLNLVQPCLSALAVRWKEPITFSRLDLSQFEYARDLTYLELKGPSPARGQSNQGPLLEGCVPQKLKQLVTANLNLMPQMFTNSTGLTSIHVRCAPPYCPAWSWTDLDVLKDLQVRSSKIDDLLQIMQS